MIYRGEGGLGLVVGVMVEMVEMILGFWSFGEDNNGGEREREFLQSLERASSSKMQHPSPLFI